jgi:hypothetical protein
MLSLSLSLSRSHFIVFSKKICKTTFIKRWVDLLSNDKIIEKRVNYMKDRHWLDRQTKYVNIEYLVYNGQVEPLICKVVITFDFTRGIVMITVVVIHTHFHRHNLFCLKSAYS